MDRRDRKEKMQLHLKKKREIERRKNPIEPDREISLFDKVYGLRQPPNSNGLVMGLWPIAMAHPYGES